MPALTFWKTHVEQVIVYHIFSWCCPFCGYENNESIDYGEMVQCDNCFAEYKVKPKENDDADC